MSTLEFQQDISPTNLIRGKEKWGGGKKENTYLLGIIEDLFSYNTINRKRVLEYYFFQDSTYASPSITVSGVDHIQQ